MLFWARVLSGVSGEPFFFLVMMAFFLDHFHDAIVRMD